MALWSRCRPLLVVGLLLLYGWRAYVAAGSMSLTFDEIIYPAAGLHCWQTGEFLLNYENPPLAKLWVALPALLSGLRAPAMEQISRQNLSYQYTYGMNFLHALGAGKRQTILHARLMTVVAGLALCLVVWFAARAWSGPDAGCIVLLLVSLCPTLIAYGSVATTELMLTFWYTLCVIAAVHACEGGRRGWFVLCGVALGGALLSKNSALSLLPVLAVFVAIAWGRGKTVPLRLLMLAGVIALFVLLAGYRFGALDVYFDGLTINMSQMFSVNRGGHNTFLAGNMSPEGWWYFYFAVLALKTSLGIWVVLLVAIAGIIADGRWRQMPQILYVCCALAVLLYGASSGNFQTGIRYVLPALPLLYLWLGIETFSRLRVPGFMRMATVVALVLVAIHSYRATGGYFTAFNELVGTDGRKYLVDCNSDWGQDLPKLKEYLDMQGKSLVLLSYFGNDNPADYGITYLDVAQRSRTLPMCIVPDVDAEKIILAVSWTNAASVYYPDNLQLFSWLESMPEPDIVGSFVCYDIGESQSARNKIIEVLETQGRREEIEKLNMVWDRYLLPTRSQQ